MTDESFEFPDVRWRASFRRRILTWFRKHARDLPWRNSPDPYAVWVSETMLQQTQVATVKPYYAKFLKAFPNVKRLAAAPEEKILRLWEGLGYYRRARQLHSAARMIVAKYGGQFPTNFDDVLGLPGIGRYTAGAILSLSIDQRQPIVEANTVRLYSRLLGYENDPTKTAGQKVLWQFAEDVLPKRGAGELNSAMMDLGSLICTPKTPSCSACPVATLCRAHQTGLVESIPVAKKKTNYTDVTEVAVVIRSRGRVLVRQCAKHERWAGLWDFPRAAVASPAGAKRTRELTSAVHQLTGIPIRLGDKLITMKHGVTRYRITLHCFDAHPISPSTRSTKTQKWVRLDDLNNLPLSVTGRKISQLLHDSASGSTMPSTQNG